MELIWHDDFATSASYRQALFQFTSQVFSGADFETWYNVSGWDGKYQPLSLFDGPRLVANVSYSEMTLLINGKTRPGIQFATVGTLPEYRNRGLSRQLMNTVLDRYRDQNPLFFLFANDDVLDFYPKFGFRRVQEKVFTADVTDVDKAFGARKLDISCPSDFDLIRQLSTSRRPITRRFGATDYGHIFIWHCLNTQPENLWYLKDERVLLVMEKDGNRLTIFDILHDDNLSFKALIPKFLPAGVTQIEFYFTPELLGLDTTTTPSADPFFVMGDFPVEDEDIKFPATAQT